MTYYGIQNKHIAFPKEKRRIHIDSDSNLDLADRIDSLHRAFANERGKNHRFREAVRAKLGLRVPEEDEEA